MKLLITILFLVPVTLCEVDNYIVGGDIIEIDQVPYLVGIYLYGLIFSCGGSLISKNYVLTAGHCINSMFTYKVRIGSDDKYEGGVMIDVVNSTRHPKYKNLDYDYGLMELKEGEKLPDVVKFIQLANENDVTKDGEQMFIAGWGETNSNETDGYLRGALVPFLSNEKCEKSYGKNFTDRMVCAGYEEGGIDTCQGKKKS